MKLSLKENPEVIFEVTSKWVEGDGVEHFYARDSSTNFYSRIMKNSEGKYWAGLRELELIDSKMNGVIDLDATTLKFTIPPAKKEKEKEIRKEVEVKKEVKKKGGNFWESI